MDEQRVQELEARRERRARNGERAVTKPSLETLQHTVSDIPSTSTTTTHLSSRAGHRSLRRSLLRRSHPAAGSLPRRRRRSHLNRHLISLTLALTVDKKHAQHTLAVAATALEASSATVASTVAARASAEAYAYDERSDEAVKAQLDSPPPPPPEPRALARLTRMRRPSSS